MKQEFYEKQNVEKVDENTEEVEDVMDLPLFWRREKNAPVGKHQSRDYLCIVRDL